MYWPVIVLLMVAGQPPMVFTDQAKPEGYATASECGERLLTGMIAMAQYFQTENLAGPLAVEAKCVTTSPFGRDA